MDMRTFLKDMKKKNGLTTKDLSEKSGVGVRCIRKMEQGHTENIRLDKINDVLWLFGHEMQPTRTYGR